MQNQNNKKILRKCVISLLRTWRKRANFLELPSDFFQPIAVHHYWLYKPQNQHFYYELNLFIFHIFALIVSGKSELIFLERRWTMCPKNSRNFERLLSFQCILVRELLMTLELLHFSHPNITIFFLISWH